MRVPVRCTSCGASYEVPQEALGRKASCKKCGEQFPLTVSGNGPVDTSRAGRTAGPTHGARASRSGEHIGRFELKSHLGAGAFGDVYRAFDTLLKRDVAIKLPHPAVFAKESHRARFLREPQAAAGLRHPNIVPIYDAGLEGEQFYIASAFIDGTVLQRRIEEKRPGFPQAARMVVSLAEALDYAHGQGIIHRDIKPANIMLDRKDEPLVMDFGLARLREAEDQLTHDGTVLGTPAYMAPEQAAARHAEVGPASDQYSLGVVLYELLCGERPFEGPAAAVISMVIHQEPLSPRARLASVPRDLDTICQKAMAKRPQDRYATCGELAGDLRRYLNNEPIRARKVGLAERAVRWTRREPVVAGMTAAVAVVLLLGAIVSSLFAARASEQARLADENARKADEKASEALSRLYLAEMAKIQSAWEERDYDRIKTALKAATPGQGAPDFRGWEWYYFQTLNQKPLRSFELPFNRQLTLAWHPAGDRFVTGGGAPANYSEPNLAPTRIWEVSTGRLVQELSPLGCHPAWSPDGSRLAAATNRGIVVWDAADGKELMRADAHDVPVWAIAWSPDGKRIASGSSQYDEPSRACQGKLVVWDVAENKEVFSTTTTPIGVGALAWNPSGTRLAIGYRVGNTSPHESVAILDANTGSLVRALGEASSSSCNRVVWNPEGNWVASNRASWSGLPIDVWDVESGKKIRTLDNGGVDFAWSPADQLAGVAPLGSIGSLIKLWDADALIRRTVVWLPGDGWYSSVDWNKDATQLATLSGSTEVPGARLDVWRVDQLYADHAVYDVHGPNSTSRSMAWSPDGRRCASGGMDGSISIVDVPRGTARLNFGAHEGGYFGVTWLAWSNDGKQLLSLGREGYIKRWNTQTGKAEGRLEVPDNAHRILLAELSPKGDKVLIAAASGTVGVLRTDGSKFRLPGMQPLKDATALAWHPKGAVVATADNAGTIKVFNVQTDAELWSEKSHAAAIHALEFSQDGRLLAAGDALGIITVKAADTGKQVWTNTERTTPIVAIAWPPDGRRLAVAEAEGVVRLWETRYWTAVLRIRDTVYSPIDQSRTDAKLTSLAWSPDGRALAAGGTDPHHREYQGLLHIWTAVPEKTSQAAN